MLDELKFLAALLALGWSPTAWAYTVSVLPNTSSTPYHVIDDSWIADFDAWKGWADVNLSTRASQATLAAFQLANHTDLVQLDTDLLAFKAANHSDLALIDSDLLSFKSANHTDLAQIDSDLLAFKSSNHTDVTGGGQKTQIVNTVGTTEDFNYGSVGAQTQRTAAQVGNSTGAADFNAGATTSQTLRTAANGYDGAGNALTSQVNGPQRALDVGVDVSGVQVDPRNVGITHTTEPTAESDTAVNKRGQDAYHRSFTVSEVSSYALWGKMFRVSSNNNVTIGVLTETAFFLFRNPNGSGHNCLIKRREYGSVTASGGNAAIYKAYRDATVTAAGTSLTSVGGRNTGQATAVCLASTSPTVTSNGTLFDVDRAASSDDVRDDDFSLWLEPNHNLLVTITANATGLNPVFEMDWAEP